MRTLRPSSLEERESKKFTSNEQNAVNQAACLDRIFKKVNAEGLSAETAKELHDDIEHVAGHFNVDKKGAVLFAGILEKSFANNGMDDEDLAGYLGCSNIEFLRFNKQLRELEKAGIIQMGGGRGIRRCYRVTPEALKAVESDGVFTPVKMSGLTADELFSRFRVCFKSFRNDSIDAERLLDDLDSLISGNEHLVFCRKVLDSGLYTDCCATERRMFFYMCHRYVTHGEKSVDVDTLTNLTDFFEDDERIKRRIANERTSMQRCGLVCFGIDDGMVDSTSLAISDMVRDEFLTEVELAPEENTVRRDVIEASSIKEKELFYNESEKVQISRLENLLDGDNFKEVQNRLLSSGMRKGFNAIFYGAPGTGKTASVYELARRSGRDIFRIDVSKLKSKWVGDSEKSVRAAFKIYRALCHSCKKAPIMLFNEADAIFSKRFEQVERSVDQMNNAIQNIILEEMENLDGILIATTNLVTNMDPAFERRFIFKVEFNMPEKDSRAKIWKSMIPNLSEEDAGTLADRYDFSGGNIENIARKSAVEYVLSGKEPTLSSLDDYCREEILSRSKVRTRIGF